MMIRAQEDHLRNLVSVSAEDMVVMEAEGEPAARDHAAFTEGQDGSLSITSLLRSIAQLILCFWQWGRSLPLAGFNSGFMVPLVRRGHTAPSLLGVLTPMKRVARSPHALGVNASTLWILVRFSGCNLLPMLGCLTSFRGVWESTEVFLHSNSVSMVHMAIGHRLDLLAANTAINKLVHTISVSGGVSICQT